MRAEAGRRAGAGRNAGSGRRAGAEKEAVKQREAGGWWVALVASCHGRRERTWLVTEGQAANFPATTLPWPTTPPLGQATNYLSLLCMVIFPHYIIHAQEALEKRKYYGIGGRHWQCTCILVTKLPFLHVFCDKCHKDITYHI